MQFEVHWEDESRDVNAVAYWKILSFDKETGAGNNLTKAFGLKKALSSTDISKVIKKLSKY